MTENSPEKGALERLIAVRTPEETVRGPLIGRMSPEDGGPGQLTGIQTSGEHAQGPVIELRMPKDALAPGTDAGARPDAALGQEAGGAAGVSHSGRVLLRSAPVTVAWRPVMGIRRRGSRAPRAVIVTQIREREGRRREGRPPVQTLVTVKRKSRRVVLQNAQGQTLIQVQVRNSGRCFALLCKGL